MSLEIKKFIIQSQYFIENLESLLFGHKISKKFTEPGLIEFKSQMCDNYESMKHYAHSKIRNIYINDKVDKIIHSMVLTNQDYLSVFRLYEARYSFGNDRIVYGYEMLDKEASKLNKRKRKILFSAKNNASRELVERIFNDYNACGSMNEIFLDLFEDYNDFKESSKKILRAKKIKKQDVYEDEFYDILDLEARNKELVEYYNNFKNADGGIKGLYDTIGEFIFHQIIPNNIQLPRRLSHTDFDRDVKYVPFSIDEVVETPASSL